jgi:hypothetical protein
LNTGEENIIKLGHIVLWGINKAKAISIAVEPIRVLKARVYKIIDSNVLFVLLGWEKTEDTFLA